MNTIVIPAYELVSNGESITAVDALDGELRGSGSSVEAVVSRLYHPCNLKVEDTWGRLGVDGKITPVRTPALVLRKQQAERKSRRRKNRKLLRELTQWWGATKTSLEPDSSVAVPQVNEIPVPLLDGRGDVTEVEQVVVKQKLPPLPAFPGIGLSEPVSGPPSGDAPLAVIRKPKLASEQSSTTPEDTKAQIVQINERLQRDKRMERQDKKSIKQARRALHVHRWRLGLRSVAFTLATIVFLTAAWLIAPLVSARLSVQVPKPEPTVTVTLAPSTGTPETPEPVQTESSVPDASPTQSEQVPPSPTVSPSVAQPPPAPTVTVTQAPPVPQVTVTQAPAPRVTVTQAPPPQPAVSNLQTRVSSSGGTVVFNAQASGAAPPPITASIGGQTITLAGGSGQVSLAPGTYGWTTHCGQLTNSGSITVY